LTRARKLPASVSVGNLSTGAAVCARVLQHRLNRLAQRIGPSRSLWHDALGNQLPYALTTQAKDNGKAFGSDF
jgi:hypothetical protein